MSHNFIKGINIHQNFGTGSKETELDQAFRNMQWKTLDGRIIKVKDLTDEHLANIINYILTHPRLYPARDILIRYLHDEAGIRGLSFEFLEGAPYPRTDDN